MDDQLFDASVDSSIADDGDDGEEENGNRSGETTTMMIRMTMTMLELNLSAHIEMRRVHVEQELFR